MSTYEVNEHGVPQYPKAHAGRLVVTLAAIDMLERPTTASVAALTGLRKGHIDQYVQALRDQYGLTIVKEGPVFHITSWGELLKRAGVRKALTVPINVTIVDPVDDQS
jgi:hypothetical protein